MSLSSGVEAFSHLGMIDGWRKEGLVKVAGVNPGNDPGVTEDPSVIENRGVITVFTVFGLLTDFVC
jgi:hypothetical protein